MTQFIVAALCGVGVGILSGLFGIGGGTIMVPLFRLGFGLTALQATGTSMFTMVFTSIAGSITHIRNKTCIVPLGLLAGACGACTSPIGVYLATLSPAWLVMLATALVIAYSASTMLRKGLAMPKESAAEQSGTQDSEAVAQQADVSYEVPRLSRAQYFYGALAGVAAGLAGGYVGLGGGFLMVPIFLSAVKIPMRLASGTSLIGILILAASASVAQAFYGNLAVLAGLAMAAGSIPGAMFGSSLVKKVPERSLRLFFGAFLLVVAAILAVNEFVVA